MQRSALQVARMDCSTARPSLSLDSGSSTDRIYIFHLEPSKDSALFSTLMKLSALTIRLFGADASHCYLPHCSLSSFFAVPSSRSAPSTSSTVGTSRGCVGGLLCSCEECVWVRNVVQAFVQAPRSRTPPPLFCISPISSPSSPILTPSTAASSPVSPLSSQSTTDHLEGEFIDGSKGGGGSDEEEMPCLDSPSTSSQRARTGRENEGLMSPSYYPPSSTCCHSAHFRCHTLKLPKPLGTVLLTAEREPSSPMISRSSSSSFLRIPERCVVCEEGPMEGQEKREEGSRFIYDELCAMMFADGSISNTAAACILLREHPSLTCREITRRYGYPSRPITTDGSHDHDGIQSSCSRDFTRWDTLSLASPTSLPPSPSSVSSCTSPCHTPPTPSLRWPPSCIPLAPRCAPTDSSPVLCTTTGYVVISLQCEYLQVFMNNLTHSLVELPDPVVVKPKKVNHITVASERERTEEEGASSVQRSIEALYRQALSYYPNDICEFDVVLYECLERSRGYNQDGVHSLREVLRVHNAVSLTAAMDR
eukprot:GHVS01049454.1.p1 GENE.GHVS01049454.1~~GHVS01049454.1.p1  ORF type:complete len:536 (+),score=67.82 GHVS01049454.1:205-1812(+)